MFELQCETLQNLQLNAESAINEMKKVKCKVSTLQENNEGMEKEINTLNELLEDERRLRERAVAVAGYWRNREPEIKDWSKAEKVTHRAKIYRHLNIMEETVSKIKIMVAAGLEGAPYVKEVTHQAEICRHLKKVENQISKVETLIANGPKNAS